MSFDEAFGAFSGKVDTGFPQKMRPLKKLEQRREPDGSG